MLSEAQGEIRPRSPEALRWGGHDTGGGVARRLARSSEVQRPRVSVGASDTRSLSQPGRGQRFPRTGRCPSQDDRFCPGTSGDAPVLFSGPGRTPGPAGLGVPPVPSRSHARERRERRETVTSVLTLDQTWESLPSPPDLTLGSGGKLARLLLVVRLHRFNPLHLRGGGETPGSGVTTTHNIESIVSLNVKGWSFSRHVGPLGAVPRPAATRSP